MVGGLWLAVGGWRLVVGRFASFSVSFSVSLPSSFALLLSSLGRATVIVTRSLAVVVVVVVVVVMVVVVVVVAGCVAWFVLVMLASGHVLWSYASMF